jgi:hypothetical protein
VHRRSSRKNQLSHRQHQRLRSRARRNPNRKRSLEGSADVEAGFAWSGAEVRFGTRRLAPAVLVRLGVKGNMTGGLEACGGNVLVQYLLEKSRTPGFGSICGRADSVAKESGRILFVVGVRHGEKLTIRSGSGKSKAV